MVKKKEGDNLSPGQLYVNTLLDWDRVMLILMIHYDLGSGFLFYLNQGSFEIESNTGVYQVLISS